MENVSNMFYNYYSSLIPYIHSNDSVIQKVKEWKAEGFKVNVFIGKTPSTSDSNPGLPENGENEKWISLSIEYPDLNYCFNFERFHLVLNCNKTEEMKLIEKLFDKVVIDLSVTKGFYESAFLDVANLVSLGGTLIMPELVPILGPYSKRSPSVQEIEYFCVRSSPKEEMDYHDKLMKFELKYFATFLNQEIIPSSNILKQVENLATQNQDLILGSVAYCDWEKNQDQQDREIISWQEAHVKVHLFFEALAKNEGIISPCEVKKEIAYKKAKTDLLERFKVVNFCKDDSYWSSWKTDYVKAEERYF